MVSKRLPTRLVLAMVSLHNVMVAAETEMAVSLVVAMDWDVTMDSLSTGSTVEVTVRDPLSLYRIPWTISILPWSRSNVHRYVRAESTTLSSCNFPVVVTMLRQLLHLCALLFHLDLRRER